MNASTMVAYLIRISNANLFFNLLNHIIALAGVAVCLLIWKNGVKKLYSILLQATTIYLLATVAANGAYYGNPFHVITFLIMILLVVLFQYKDKKWSATESQSPHIMSKLDVVFILFVALGIWYPEFTDVSMFKSILFSPLGIVPCPTIIVTLGLMNLNREIFGARTRATMLFFTLVYGMIGFFVFHVYFDVALLLEAGFAAYCLFCRKAARQADCKQHASSAVMDSIV